MPLSHSDAKASLEQLIFIDEKPQEWVQDVWDMSPTLGETAARLSEVFDAVMDSCPPEQLETVLKTLSQQEAS